MAKPIVPTYYTIDMEISIYSIDILVFPLALLAFIYLNINIYYWSTPFQKDFQKLMVIITNGFGIFPVIIADGIFLKFMILGAMITSFWAHINWENFSIPGFEDNPGKWDNAFSASVIIAYCCSFFPDRWFSKCFENNKRKPRGIDYITRPWHTNSCSLPLNTKTLCQVVCTTISFFIILLNYETNPTIFSIGDVGFKVGDILCIGFAVFAIIVGLLYVCNTPDHLTNRTKFEIFISLGIGLAIYAIISKKAGENSKLPEAVHSVWHICIFVAAYCISRAHSYIKMYKNFI